MTAHRPVYATSEVRDELIAAIGEQATLALIHRWGGTMIYVPATCLPHHGITSLIGVRAATKLSEAFGSMRLTLPKAHARRAGALDAALAARDGQSNMKIADVAVAFDYTERGIYKLLEKHDAGQSSDQLDLFRGD